MQFEFTNSSTTTVASLPINTVFKYDGEVYIRVFDRKGICGSGVTVIHIASSGFVLTTFGVASTMVEILGSVKVKL